MKWRQIDQDGHIKSNPNLDSNLSGPAEYRLTSDLNTQFVPKVPAKILEANTIAPPG